MADIIDRCSCCWRCSRCSAHFSRSPCSGCSPSPSGRRTLSSPSSAWPRWCPPVARKRARRTSAPRISRTWHCPGSPAEQSGNCQLFKPTKSYWDVSIYLERSIFSRNQSASDSLFGFPRAVSEKEFDWNFLIKLLIIDTLLTSVGTEIDIWRLKEIICGYAWSGYAG